MLLSQQDLGVLLAGQLQGGAQIDRRHFLLEERLKRIDVRIGFREGAGGFFIASRLVVLVADLDDLTRWRSTRLRPVAGRASLSLRLCAARACRTDARATGRISTIVAAGRGGVDADCQGDGAAQEGSFGEGTFHLRGRRRQSCGFRSMSCGTGRASMSAGGLPRATYNSNWALL